MTGKSWRCVDAHVAPPSLGLGPGVLQICVCHKASALVMTRDERYHGIGTTASAALLWLLPLAQRQGVGNKRHDCTSLRRAICVCGGPALRLHYTSTAKGSHAVDEQTTAVGDDERLHATSSLVFLDSCDKLGGEPEPCSTEAATIQSTSV